MARLHGATLVSFVLLCHSTSAQLFSNTTSSRSSTAAPLSTSSIATATTSQSTTTSTTLSTYGTSITDFPGATGLCCVLYPIGVGVNTWYEQPVSVITATVHSTYLDYNGTRILNGTSTELAKGFNGSAYFSTYPVLPSVGNITRVAGIPNTLLPTEANLYGMTSVQTATEITFTAQNLTITSPTPFWYYPGGFMQTGYSSSGTCYTTSTDGTLLWSTTVNGTYYSSSYLPTSTATVTKAFNPGGGGTNDITLDYAVPFEGNITEYMGKLFYSGVGEIEFGSFPDWPGQKWADDPLIKAQFASIGYCSDAGGLGEPTVHVAVNALTTDTTSVITMAGTPAPASPTTTSVTTSSPIALPVTTSASAHTSPSSSSVVTPPASSSSSNVISATTSTVLPSSQTTLVSQQPSVQTSVSDSTTAAVPAQSSQASTSLANLISVIQSIAVSSNSAISTSAGSSSNTALSTSDIPASSQAAQVSQAVASTTTVTASIGKLISVVQQAASSQASTAAVGSFVASGIGLSLTNAQVSASFTSQAVVVVGSSVITANSASAFVIAPSQTLVAGGSAITVSGTTLSLATSGSAIVVNGQTSQIQQSFVQVSQSTAAIGTLTAGGQAIVFTQSSGALVLGSTTVQAGAAVTISGQVVSVATNGVVNVNGTPQTSLAPQGAAPTAQVVTGVISASGQSIAFTQSSGALVLGSTTLEPGSAATISGQVVSVASNGVVNVNGLPQATIAPSRSTETNVATGILTAGSQTLPYSQAGSTAVVVGSQTIARGSVTTINGQTISIASNGAINVNGSPAVTPSSTGLPRAQATGVLTAGTQTVGYTLSGSGAVVGSQTLVPGSAIVVGGETLTLGTQSSQILVISGSKTVGTLGATGSTSTVATSHPPGSTVSVSAASASATSLTSSSAAMPSKSSRSGVVLSGALITMLIFIAL